MTGSKPLAGKIVLVTGANSGIGEAIALGFAEAGATLVLAARRAAPLEDVAARARAHGADVLAVPTDVTDIAAVDALQPERRLAEVSVEALQRSFAVNAWGPLLVAKHFSRFLPRRERAVFASISARVGSIGDNGLGGWYAYRASKAAQNMFTRNLSIELPRRHRGTLAVALHPGTVDTDLSAPFQSRVPEQQLFDAPQAARQLLAVIDGLGKDDNGGFFAWDGQPIPW